MKKKVTTRKGDIWYSPKYDSLAIVYGWKVIDSELELIVHLGHPVYVFARDADEFVENHEFIGRLGNGNSYAYG